MGLGVVMVDGNLKYENFQHANFLGGLVLVEPDIPQNTGAVMRLSACLNLPLHLIEPFGFIWNEKKIKAVALDYFEKTNIMRHQSFSQFMDNRQQPPGRKILFTTHAKISLSDWQPTEGDYCLFGSESKGVSPLVHHSVDLSLRIPMQSGLRSLNLASAVALVVGYSLAYVGHNSQ